MSKKTFYILGLFAVMATTSAFADVPVESGLASYEDVEYHVDGTHLGEFVYSSLNEVVTITGTVSNWNGSVDENWLGLWASIGLTPTHYFILEGSPAIPYAHYGDTSYGDEAHQVGLGSSDLVFCESSGNMVSMLDTYTGSSANLPNVPSNTTFDFEVVYDFAAETISGSFGGGATSSISMSDVLADGDTFLFQIFVANSDSSSLTMDCDISYEVSVTCAGVAGDANNDGKVDGSDVTILANNWQTGVDGSETADWRMGDFNNDGKVDGSDVTILANNWQAGVNGTATAVPEPSTIVLLLAAAGFFFIRRNY